jgi:hypothetical protein
MKKFVSLGAALMSGAVLAREKPAAFQGTVASHGPVKPSFDLHKPVPIPRVEREYSPVVERYGARKERQAIFEDNRNEIEICSRGTSIMTEGRP